VESFDGSSVDTSVWHVYDRAGNGGHGIRSPEAITVADGVLTITAQMIDDTLVSGGLRLRATQTYGRYEIRVRTQADDALNGVVVTWPASDDTAADGRHTIYQTNGGTPVRSVIGLTDGTDTAINLGASGEVWHTVAVEWTPESVSVHLDGALVDTVTGPVADSPHFAAIQLDALADTVDGPVTMEVDQITISSYETGAACEE
jgi:beta-glucanase (GH16 family)